MLTSEEEQSLTKLINLLGDDEGTCTSIQFTVERVKWLAEKLKEVNNEASKYSEELYNTNKELADFRERYEGC